MAISKTKNLADLADPGDGAPSRRERFALAALTGLVAVDSWVQLKREQMASYGNGPSLFPPEMHAKRAWEIADAMLAAEGGRQ